MTVEERLAGVEAGLARARRANRWLLAGLALSAALCVGIWAWFAWGAARQARIMEAEEFRLVDAAGKLRAALGLLNGEPNFSLFNSRGGGAAALLLFEDEPRLMLLDAAGGERVSLGLGKGDPVLKLRDVGGKTRASLSVYGGVPAVTLLDGAEKVRMNLWVREVGPLLSLHDAPGGGASAGISVVRGEPRLTVVTGGRLAWKAP